MIEEKCCSFSKIILQNSVFLSLQLTKYTVFCLEILPSQGIRQYIFQLNTANDQNFVCSVNNESV